MARSVHAIYPLLKHGATTMFTAEDTSRSYNWSITAWDEGEDVVDTDLGTAVYLFDLETLYAQHGAGVYTITMSDAYNPGFSKAVLKVRIPMRLEAAKFGTDNGNYGENQGEDIFTVYGGLAGNVYNYTALDLNGIEMRTADCGSFEDASPTDSDNLFNFADSIDSLIFFRVKISLETDSDDENVASLAAAGLDEVLSGIFRTVPVRDLLGRAAGSNSAGINGAVITAVHDAEITAESGSNDGFQ